MRLLIERTINTGQERLLPLSEVEPDILLRSASSTNSTGRMPQARAANGVE